MDAPTTNIDIFTTEIVRNLFGPNISHIISKSKCTHQRSSGLLYIASNCLCFYSNIFGFERKLKIQIVDITFAGLIRSTSIVIRSKCMGSNSNSNSNYSNSYGNARSDSYLEEEHVFKSFQEREYVLRIILDLMKKKNHVEKNSSTIIHTNNCIDANNNDDDDAQNNHTDNNVVRKSISSESSYTKFNTKKESITLSVPQQQVNRQRTHSDPIHHQIIKQKSTNSSIRLPIRQRCDSTPEDNWKQSNKKFSNNIQEHNEQKQHETTNRNTDRTNNNVQLPKLNVLSNKLAVKSLTTQSIIDQIKLSFEQSFPELIVQSHLIPMYTLDQFYNKFLDDNATKSLYHFQKNFFHSRNIDLTHWVTVTTTNSTNDDTIHAQEEEDQNNKDDDYNSTRKQESLYWKQSRSISFVHPRNAKIGPSTAQIFRTQHSTTIKSSIHSRSSDLMIIDTSTKLDGVPYSDCFVVEEQWILEPIDNDNLHLSIRFNINFTKATIMKKIIIKQTKQEVKHWYHLYLKYILSSDEEENDITSTSILEDEEQLFMDKKGTMYMDFVTSTQHVFMIFCVVICTYFAWQIQMIHKKISMIEDMILDLIQDENSCKADIFTLKR